MKELPAASPSREPTSFLRFRSHTLMTSSVPPLTKYFPPTFLSLPVPGDGRIDEETVLNDER